jgi:hypothetical protein
MDQNKRAYFLGITAIFIKQSLVWLDFLEENSNLQLKQDVKYKFNKARNGLKDLNNFFESVIEDKEEHYEVSAKISDFVEFLSKLSSEDRNEVIELLSKIEVEK